MGRGGLADGQELEQHVRSARTTRGSLRIPIYWELPASWRAASLLRRIAQHVAAAEGFRSGRLSVAVVGAKAMSRLHRRFLGIDSPTDVLAFDFGTDIGRRVLDGEIILCADVALQRARTALPHGAARSKLLATARAELALYLTHGILHLAGYDDHTPAGFRRMHAREDELLTRLGLGPVFARGLINQSRRRSHPLRWRARRRDTQTRPTR